jgi:hypothetical protein
MTTVTPEFGPVPLEALSLDQFWLRWGTRLNMPRETCREMWSDAEAWYSDLPYHNFQHARETLWEAMRLVDLCETHGLQVNRKALVAAALFHDAGYHLDEREYGFNTKEEFSAAILGMHGEKYGFSVVDTYTAEKAILSTYLSAVPNTLEDKILVRADLASIAGGYQEPFRRKTLLFTEEAKLLKATRGETFDHREFVKGNIRALCVYLSNDLTLGPFDTEDRQGVFKLRATANIQQWVQETAGELRLSVDRFLTELKSEAVIKLLHIRPPDSKE